MPVPSQGHYGFHSFPVVDWFYLFIYLCGRDRMVVGLLLDITLCDKVCQWLATGRWFSPGTPVSSTSKTYRVIDRLMNRKSECNLLIHKFRQITERTSHTFIWPYCFMIICFINMNNLVIPETRCAQYIWYLCFYYCHWIDTTPRVSSTH
jgi:hypothetical protein